MQLNSLNDVLEDQLADLLSAEQQLVEALPKIAAAASSNELREALQNHLQETRGHLQRLKDITPSLAATAPSKKCVGMEGLLREGEEIIKGEGDPLAKDAALIAAAQRVEHYEIAAYGTARTLAGELGFDDAKDLLDQTLDEESNADSLLTKIATGGLLRSGVNAQAVK
jgi:ferritin-like metal-binding protein YciE